MKWADRDQLASFHFVFLWFAFCVCEHVSDTWMEKSQVFNLQNVMRTNEKRKVEMKDKKNAILCKNEIVNNNKLCWSRLTPMLSPTKNIADGCVCVWIANALCVHQQLERTLHSALTEDELVFSFYLYLFRSFCVIHFNKNCVFCVPMAISIVVASFKSDIIIVVVRPKRA